MGGHRQAIKLTEHDLVRLATVPAGIVVFAEAKFEFVATSKEQQRIVSAGDEHRTRFAGAEIFLSDLAAVLAWRDPQRDVVLVLHHGAVGPAVDPVRVRITHDDEIVRADIAAAVVLVQERHRKLKHVHLAVAIDILEHRTLRDGRGRNWPVALHPLAVGAHDIKRVVGNGQPERDREPLR